MVDSIQPTHPRSKTADRALILGFLALILYSFVMLFADSSRRTPWDRLAGTLVARRQAVD